MKAMIVGDTHGNIDWLRKYILPVAMTVQADAVIVVGDFGAWEHTSAGVLFFDQVDRAAEYAGLTVFWLHGNHDKFSHTLAYYGHMRDASGFVACRKNLFYIPQGLSWTWGAVSFRSFGGAYSIDKAMRIQGEKSRYSTLLRQARSKAANNIFTTDIVPSQEQTLWFPEEEMTDAEMEQLLLDDFGRKDIVLSHDKPLSAKPDWDRKDYPACVPNQIRLEQALRRHKPSWWIHGHLHYHYVSPVHGADWVTTVVGLDPDNHAAEGAAWRRENSWVLAELSGAQPMVVLGRDLKLDTRELVQARSALAG